MGGHISVGAIEPQFYAELLRLLEHRSGEMPPQVGPRALAGGASAAGGAVQRPGRRRVGELLEGDDACVTAGLRTVEAPAAPARCARGTFVEFDGIVQPAPAPRFSRTAAEATPAQDDVGAAVARWGLDARALGLA